MSFVGVFCVLQWHYTLWSVQFQNTSPQSQTDQTCSYAVMRDCWLAEPGLRPSFSELAEKIASVLTDGSKGVSLVLVSDVVVLCGGGLVACWDGCHQQQRVIWWKREEVQLCDDKSERMVADEMCCQAYLQLSAEEPQPCPTTFTLPRYYQSAEESWAFQEGFAAFHWISRIGCYIALQYWLVGLA